MGLSREEQLEIERAHRERLEAEEQERLAKVRSATRATTDTPAPAEISRDREVDEIRRNTEQRFYKERGYKRYIDHRKRVHWLPPDEYDYRMARRKERSREHRGNRVDTDTQRRVVFMAVVLLLGVVIGSMLAR